mgnify:CR=1 FL=1
MTDKKISNFEIVTLNYFLTRAFLIGIVFNILINSLKQDSWIVPIISIVPALIFIFFISYIMDYKSDLNITEKILTLFNKKIGIIIIILTNIIVFTISIINFLNMTKFIQSQFLNKTPLAVICILLGITSFYIVSKGISVITRTSNILFYIGFILLVLSFIGLIPTFNIGNIKPMFISSIKDYSKGLNAFFSFNIFPIFLITMIPKNIINEPKTKEVLIASYIISSISMFFIIFQTINYIFPIRINIFHLHKYQVLLLLHKMIRVRPYPIVQIPLLALLRHTKNHHCLVLMVRRFLHLKKQYNV